MANVYYILYHSIAYYHHHCIRTQAEFFLYCNFRYHLRTFTQAKNRNNPEVSKKKGIVEKPISTSFLSSIYFKKETLCLISIHTFLHLLKGRVSRLKFQNTRLFIKLPNSKLSWSTYLFRIFPRAVIRHLKAKMQVKI